MKFKKGFAFLLIVVELCIGFAIGRFYLADSHPGENVLTVAAYQFTDGDSPEVSSSVSSGNDSRSETLSPQEVTESGLSGVRVPVSYAESSCQTYAQGGARHTAMEACDGDLETSWQEAEDGPGIGSSLRFVFDEPHLIKSMVFYLGVWRERNGVDYYYENYRPKEIQISLGDQSWEVEFPDEKLAWEVTFPTPAETDEVTLTIQDVYKTDNYDETGITELIFLE